MSRPTAQQISSSGSEDGHQTALFAHIASGLVDGWLPAELELLYAIPNGGSRGDDAKSRAIRGAKLKATGVKPGVPDMHWPVARGSYHSLYIELKRPGSDRGRAGVESQEQIALHPKLRAQGNAVVTCYGWEAALDALHAYHIGELAQ